MFSYIAFSGANDPPSPTIIEAGSMNTEQGYIAFKNDYDATHANSYYYFENGTTGEIEYEGTNCSALIQEILDDSTYGVSIHFKKGSYFLDTTIEIEDTVLTVTGEQISAYTSDSNLVPASHLVLVDNVTRGMFFWNISHGNRLYCGLFRDIELNGGGTTLTATVSVPWQAAEVGSCALIWIEGGISDLSFEREFFSHCATDAVRIGAYENPTWNFWFRNCWFESIAWNAIALHTGITSPSGHNLERVIIESCHFYDNGHDIVIYDSCVNDVLITKNTSELTKWTFLYTMYGARDIVASNNLIYDGGDNATGDNSNAFSINATKYAVFSNNIIKNFENSDGFEDGFYITNSEHIDISNNMIYNLTGNGIEFQFSSVNCSATDNHVFDVDLYPIIVQAGCQAEVHGNTGFVTENSGTQASCINGTWIAHGLAGDPGTTGSITLALRCLKTYNATIYFNAPTVIASNATHFQVEFTMWLSTDWSLHPVSATEAQTIHWDAVYIP